MQRDWDERARKDPFFYVDSARIWAGPEEFFAAGAESYDRLVEPELRTLGVDPSGKRLLELGCGVGRMTGAFAQRFGRVVAVDVSGEMLQLGRRYLAGVPNVDWVQVSGADLAMFPEGSFDVAFTHLVLQHVPDEATALGLVREMLRVLRSGGAFLIEFNSRPQPSRPPGTCRFPAVRPPAATCSGPPQDRPIAGGSYLARGRARCSPGTGNAVGA